jgi:ActR/RegA family two-component response regulator
LAKQARLIRPGIKVLFETGYAQLATTRQAISYGQVLYKPLRETQIIEAIELLIAA